MPSSAVVWRAAPAACRLASPRGRETRAGGAGTTGRGGAGARGAAPSRRRRRSAISWRVLMASPPSSQHRDVAEARPRSIAAHDADLVEPGVELGGRPLAEQAAHAGD